MRDPAMEVPNPKAQVRPEPPRPQPGPELGASPPSPSSDPGGGAPSPGPAVPGETRAAPEPAGPLDPWLRPPAATGTTDSSGLVQTLEQLPKGVMPSGDVPPLGAGFSTASANCGNPACPYCADKPIRCPATGKEYYPIPEEYGELIASIAGPLAASAPFRNVDVSQLTPEQAQLVSDLAVSSKEEQQMIKGAAMAVLRKRMPASGGENADLWAAGFVALSLTLPRIMLARSLPKVEDETEGAEQ